VKVEYLIGESTGGPLVKNGENLQPSWKVPKCQERMDERQLQQLRIEGEGKDRIVVENGIRGIEEAAVG
jgi:hypothetical protein